MRLIDADALDETFSRLNDDGWQLTRGDHKRVEAVLFEMPTIDAVPVVRCGECIHRFVDGDNVRFNVCMLNHNKVQPDDWFCADGERKDGDGDA